MTKTRYALMSLAVVLTVLFQLAMPVIVRADDTTPPTDQPTEVATDPGTGTPDGSTPTEVATPVPTTDATATDAVATAVPASADDPAPATEVAPLMSQVPDGTDVVVLNPDGSAASLATQAAADAIATSDPIWCPAGQSPTTDTDAVTAGIQNGCTAPYSNFTSLLGDTSISGDGTIYVEAGIYAGSETSVQFDGSVLTGWGALTLQGGWDLDSSSGTYDSLVGTSDFSIPITVTNWGSAVSLYDLTVSGAGIQVDNSASTSAAPVVLSAVDQSGNTSGDGVAVISNGNVSLTNVTATDNSGNGAAVDTTSGTGNVAVTGGAYSNNGAAGLKVNSGGSVSLNNVPEVQTVTVPPACGETYTDLGFQLVFQDATASTLLADTSTASDIQTALNTLTTVTVSGPDGGPWQVIFGTTGIMEPVQAVRECVDSSSVSQDPAPSSLATVDTWGTVVAQGNTGDGLNINGNGDVTVEGAYLNDNSGWGMKVTSTGSIFVGGGGYSGVVAGLDYSQFVELDPIPLVPMGNTLGGASLNAGGDIWVGQSLFAYSGDCPGIEAYANGDITLIDVIGAGNIGEGAILNNAAGSGDVEVDGSYFFDNGSTGLDVYSSGDITLNTVFATGLNFEFLPIGLSLTDGFSQQDGIYIDNSYGMGDINVTTAILAGNTWTGLTAYSNGDIELDGVLAMGNGTGAILDNTTGDGSIVVNDSGFLGNAWTGLDAYSNGDINLTDVAALGMGILASSAVSTPSTPPAPLITQEYGAYLDTSSGTGSIYISASDFSENAYGGLTAQTSTGDISLVDVTATMNGYQETPVLDEEGNPVLDEFGNPEFQVVADDGSYGVGLASSGGGTISVAGTMTLSGSVPDGSSSYFSENAGVGLWIDSNGPIDLTDIQASGNGWKGAYIGYMAPCGDTGGIDVTITGGLYQGNDAFGVYAVVGPAGTLTLVNDSGAFAPLGGGNGPSDASDPSLYDFYADTSVQTCPPPEVPPEPGKDYNIVNVSGDGSESIPLDCTLYAGTILVLPEGDRATLFCTVDGEAALTSLTQDKLPGPLPSGFNFVAGMTVGITKDGVPVTLIKEGGSITVAFPIPEGNPHARYSILYWDPTAKDGQGAWVEMPPFEKLPDGTPISHHLHPGLSPDDMMRILSGVHQEGGFVKLQVNFTGTFVLVTK